jgi:hypothetical protein
LPAGADRPDVASVGVAGGDAGCWLRPLPGAPSFRGAGGADGAGEGGGRRNTSTGNCLSRAGAVFGAGGDWMERVVSGRPNWGAGVGGAEGCPPEAPGWFRGGRE